MSVFELIVDWVIDPLLNMVSGWHISGKWRISYLCPVATAAGAGIWWLGDRFDIILLLVFGALITVLFGIFSVVTFIPREVESWKDIKALERRNKAEADDKENKKEQ
jgi:hypothetical protein